MWLGIFEGLLESSLSLSLSSPWPIKNDDMNDKHLTPVWMLLTVALKL